MTIPFFNAMEMKKKNALLIAAGALIASAAAFFMVRKSQSGSSEKPPKGAPQLNIENPGSQAEFPAAPQPSDLG